MENTNEINIIVKDKKPTSEAMKRAKAKYYQKKKSFQRLDFPQEAFQFYKLKMTPKLQIWISVRRVVRAGTNFYPPCGR